MKKKTYKRNVDFLLNNKHYRRLHLILYFISILIIILTYFITGAIFETYISVIVTSIVSVGIGSYIAYNRDIIVKQMSNYEHDLQLKKRKKENKHGLNTTLKKITPRNKNLKFNIKNKTTLKEKIKNVKIRINKKPKKDYFEVK